MRGRVAIAVAAIGLVLPGAAWATIPASFAAPGSCPRLDAADNNALNGYQLPYWRCDDGVPAEGGTTPNTTGDNAITVPAKYGGDGYTGLPPQAADANTMSGAALSGPEQGTVALDADISFPDPLTYPPPAAGYPLIVLMHGCCSGDKTSWEAPTIAGDNKEQWHYNNAWFASRGWAVLTYTARGFVNGQNQGSTGETQLDSRRYEINDYQNLVAQLVDTTFTLGASAPFTIDPQRVVVTGGSYGGGFTWLALTDPDWASALGTPIRLAAAAPKYGWSDLVDSLWPNGSFDVRDALPTTDPAKADKPLGFPKKSINQVLYASGKTGFPPGFKHTTFPASIDQASSCIQSSDPFDQNPLCTSTLSTLLPEFLSDRSAYYQNDFFARLAAGQTAPVPLFSAGTLTDPLFPPAQHRHMVDRLESAVPGYPVQEYYGDYQHFVQSKPKEWDDVCGSDHHVCTLADYQNGLNAPPLGLVSTGVTTMLNNFIDHYARPQGDPSGPSPAFDVTAALQICPQNAGSRAADEPGPRFTAPMFGALAPNDLVVKASGAQTTTSEAEPNEHAKNADPVGNSEANGGKCPVEQSPSGFASAGPGVATYDSAPLPQAYTMIGQTRATVAYSANGGSGGFQLNARLYDLFPDGTEVMVDRGVHTLASPKGTAVIDLHGNGWRFPKGHVVRIELAQDDDPYIKRSNQPSSLALASARLDIPIREGSATIPGTAPAPLPGVAGGGPGGPGGPAVAGGPVVSLHAPAIASDESRGRTFPLRILTGSNPGAIAYFQLQAASSPKARYRTIARHLTGPRYRFAGRLGRTYRFRARAIAKDGKPGPWANARTIVPFDDRLGPSRPRYSAGWSRQRDGHAWLGRLSATRQPGARMTFSFRGDGIGIVARVGRRGGRALLLLDGKRVHVSFRARRTRERRTVFARFSLRRKRRHTLVLIARTGRVTVDGLAVLNNGR